MSLRHENIVRVREVVVGSSADKVWQLPHYFIILLELAGCMMGRGSPWAANNGDY